MSRLYLIFCLVIFGIGCTGVGVATYKFMAQRVAVAQAETAAVAVERDTLAQALKAAQEQRKRDQALLARRAADNAAAARQMASLQKALAAALAANSEWATTPVPREVQDAFGP